ncbi:MAG: hypothetical protein HPY51_12745 [Candidatus Omnitrophica bacterium]|nr:hypothetical protein [Candidatus Omnitrophota bacterium]
MENIKPPCPECVIIPGRLPKNEIAFVNAVLDDMEGMVVVRTEEAEEGRMEYWVAPGFVEEFREFASIMREHWGIPMTLADPIPQSTEIRPYYEKGNSPDRGG